jgi:hypothetical protein
MTGPNYSQNRAFVIQNVPHQKFDEGFVPLSHQQIARRGEGKKISRFNSKKSKPRSRSRRSNKVKRRTELETQLEAGEFVTPIKNLMPPTRKASGLKP